MYSALKRGGEPLYAAGARRAWRSSAPRARGRRFTNCDRLLPFDGGGRCELDVRCSKGTYVRSLVRGPGRRLGCGAHVGGLRRLWVGAVPRRRAWSRSRAAAGRCAERRRARSTRCLLPADGGLAGWPPGRPSTPTAALGAGAGARRCGWRAAPAPAGRCAVLAPGGRAAGHLAEADAEAAAGAAALAGLPR